MNKFHLDFLFIILFFFGFSLDKNEGFGRDPIKLIQLLRDPTYVFDRSFQRHCDHGSTMLNTMPLEIDTQSSQDQMSIFRKGSDLPPASAFAGLSQG